MVFVVRKEGNSYVVRNRYTRASRHVCKSHSEAARVAHALNREQERTGARPALAALAQGGA